MNEKQPYHSIEQSRVNRLGLTLTRFIPTAVIFAIVCGVAFGEQKQTSNIDEARKQISSAHEIWAYWEKVKGGADIEGPWFPMKSIETEPTLPVKEATEKQETITDIINSLGERLPNGWWLLIVGAICMGIIIWLIARTLTKQKVRGDVIVIDGSNGTFVAIGLIALAAAVVFLVWSVNSNKNPELHVAPQVVVREHPSWSATCQRCGRQRAFSGHPPRSLTVKFKCCLPIRQTSHRVQVHP